MTGIGQVTFNFLRELVQLPEVNALQFILYTEGLTELPFDIPKNFRVKPFLPWWKRDDVLRQWLWERQLAQQATQDGCDVFLNLYQAATIFSNARTIRHVMLVHDLIPQFFPEYLAKWSSRLHYRAILRAIRRAHSLITPSLATQRDIVTALALTETPIEVVPLGVAEQFLRRLTPAALEQTLARYQLSPGYLYHGGGLEIRKNTQRIIEAYGLLVEKRTPHLPPLVISGRIYAPSNPLATPVMALIRRFGLERQVQLLGPVPDADLPVLYQGARCFLYASRSEGFGLPVLEAYASGTPVLTTAAGALAELIDDKLARVVSTEGTAEEYAEALLALLAEPVNRQQISEYGRAKAASYTWRNFAQSVLRTLLQ